MTIHEILQAIQTELKAPKSQVNKFGGYKFRNCEDILESVKPLLAKHKASVTCSDEMVEIGGRFYIKATATLYANGESTFTTAFAREPEIKKGMDESQITGASSSYARKYALNGLFAIDDTKDADTYQGESQPTETPKPNVDKPKQTPLQKEVNTLAKSVGALLGSTPADAYKSALVNLNIQGKTDEELTKVVAYFKNVIEKSKQG